MISVGLKPLMTRLNPTCTRALQGAAGLCVARGHYEVTVEHLASKLLEERGADWTPALEAFGVEPGEAQRLLEGTLGELRTGNGGKPVFSPVLLDLLQEGWLVSSVDLGEGEIRSGALLLVLLGRPGQFASGPPMDLLGRINRETLAREFRTLTRHSVENGPAPARGGGGEGGFIDRFCQDFTRKAREGGIDPVFGRDGEIRRMVDILARRRKNNPICVGDPGVGKTAVVEGLALRIAEGDVPGLLQGVTLLGLDMGLLEAGAGMKGEFENRLKGVINEIKASPRPIILFIDEAHTLIGAGGAAGGSDAANLLKPALARGELRTVAATTWGEYKKYFEKDPALARRFQLVKLDPPTVEDTVLILRGLRPSYEKAHGVVIRDDAVRAAAVLSDKYVTGRFLPDKAIDLLDTACARVKINLTSKPPALEDLERGLQALDRERGALERDRDHGVAIDAQRLLEVLAEAERRRGEAEALRARWEREREAAHRVVAAREALGAAGPGEREAAAGTLAAAAAELGELQADRALIQIDVNPDGVAQVVSDWTGVPLGKVLRDEAETILHLASRIGERIKGQDQALAALGEGLKAAKAGVKDPRQPLGVFLFVGPSGVGKTETALTLADLLFGSEKQVVAINMSEFQERHTVSRLVGSPPGYVGYGEGGMLTEAVRQKPYSVVLLDECEKAHPDVMNTFYQVFDKGTLADGEGKEIDFRNTIIILTSNLGSEVIQEMTSRGPVPAESVTAAIRPLLSRHFKPALLARMGIVPFFSLDPSALEGIVALKLQRVARTLRDNNRMVLEHTPAVVERITARCTDVESGARNIEHILNAGILPQLSQEILAAMGSGTLPSRALLDVDGDGAFVFRFEP
ncbi:type VI secretion system ATPase TssH [Mesoterricola silvestris]|uniref:ClpV1 family T6SS ATPase n=1 Tax=Mesoterricola silvestris TaxID=2927979 RepID=A0AA48KA42_9BACT|nr:type VI secretion system ATPase TssH [Mesoterricola silvestris]BDU73730.1 ClpV1 family T6SS ATPase [Mesoterricola silvestris]